ncbi:hypothetical protein [Suttonella indologenes]|uniref:hypothetical protein n=1 Tax=Suttonella indologenes TaxID=13276 RepID=UPI001FE96519|nr:hypothetical protein [Suttonella indologenes]
MLALPEPPTTTSFLAVILLLLIFISAWASCFLARNKVPVFISLLSKTLNCPFPLMPILISETLSVLALVFTMPVEVLL